MSTSQWKFCVGARIGDGGDTYIVHKRLKDDDDFDSRFYHLKMVTDMFGNPEVGFKIRSQVYVEDYYKLIT